MSRQLECEIVLYSLSSFVPLLLSNASAPFNKWPRIWNHSWIYLMHRTKHLLKTSFLENQLLEENNTGNSVWFTRQNITVFLVLGKVMTTCIFEKKAVQCRFITFLAKGNITYANKDKMLSISHCIQWSQSALNILISLGRICSFLLRFVPSTKIFNDRNYRVFSAVLIYTSQCTEWMYWNWMIRSRQIFKMHWELLY